MKAAVMNLSDEQVEWWNAENGQEVTVVGFAIDGSMLMAVWIDGEGHAHHLPAWALLFQVEAPVR